jgi:hypothetical protein
MYLLSWYSDKHWNAFWESVGITREMRLKPRYVDHLMI